MNVLVICIDHILTLMVAFFIDDFDLFMLSNGYGLFNFVTKCINGSRASDGGGD